MEDYAFVLAGNDDLAEVMDIYHSLIGFSGGVWSLDYPDTETVRSDIGKHSLYVLREGGRIIAAAAAGAADDLDLADLQWDLQNPCELARLGVAVPFHRRGVGTVMLRKVIAKTKRQGFDGMVMLVGKANRAALALYEKNGFEKCGETFMYDKDFYCLQTRFYLTTNQLTTN